MLRQELYRDAVEAEGHGGPDAYSVMAHDAADVAPGADGLLCLPYFAGERTPLNDPEARGVFFGLTGRHTRAIWFAPPWKASRIPLHPMSTLSSESMDCQLGALCLSEVEPRIQFGCSYRRRMRREVSVAKVTMGACFGDAIMAALAGGAYASWDELAQVLGVAQTIVPDMAAHELYASRRHIFDELYARNRDLMHELV